MSGRERHRPRAREFRSVLTPDEWEAMRCSDCAVWRDRLARIKAALDAALEGGPSEAQATGVMYGLAVSIGVWLAEGTTTETRGSSDG